jgi:hypothetical protein
MTGQRADLDAGLGLRGKTKPAHEGGAGKKLIHLCGFPWPLTTIGSRTYSYIILKDLLYVVQNYEFYSETRRFSGDATFPFTSSTKASDLQLSPAGGLEAVVTAARLRSRPGAHHPVLRGNP